MENYRRWLRSRRDRIDSELAGEERAVEWQYRKRVDEKVGHPIPRRRIRRDDEMMSKESKLQMLKDSVLGSMLQEAEAEDGGAADPRGGRGAAQEDEAPCRHGCHGIVMRRLHGLRRPHP